MSYTLAQQWAISGTAIVVGVIAFILAVITFIQQQDSFGDGSVVLSIGTKNGFQGTVDADGVGTIALRTSANGLLSGNQNQIEPAIPQQVTSVPLTSFQSSTSSGSSIEFVNSMLQALQKCLMLKQTPLTGFQNSNAGTVLESDTTFEAIQKLSGSQSNFDPFIFSCYSPITITHATITQPAIDTSNLVGSTTIPGNSMIRGSAFIIRLLGKVIIGTSVPSGIRIEFFWDNVLINTLTSGNITTNGTWHFVYTLTLNIEEDNIHFDTDAALSVNPEGVSAFAFDFGGSARTVGTTWQRTLPHTINVKALIQQPASPPLNSFVVSSSIGTFSSNLL